MSRSAVETKPATERSGESRDKRKRVERPERQGKPIEVSKLQHVRDGQKRPLPEADSGDKICPHCGFEGWPFQTLCPRDDHALVRRDELTTD